jgi:hypothetical protein
MRTRDDDAPAIRSNGGRSRFKYVPRDTASVQKRATQSGGMYDTFFDSRFMKFVPDAGFNCIRVLPPGWESPEHFGYDYYLHSQIGPDNSQYLCLEKMADLAKEKGLEGGRCPICEERRKLEREGETEEANQLKAAHRVGVWIIDRNNERDGPKFYDMSWSFDKDIAALQINKRTGEAIMIDDPDDGFDFEFQREGKGLNTRYIGKQIARQSSPISDDQKQQDAWLEFIGDHPIPEVLNFYSYDYLVKVFMGGIAKKEEDDPPPRRARDEETRPAPRSRASQRVEEEEEPPFEPPAASPRQRVARARLADPEVEEEEEIEAPADPVPSTARQRLERLNERNTRR